MWAVLRIKLFFHQYDTKIVNFDEGVLIICPFFWGNVIFKICPSISKVTIYVPKICLCLAASPGKYLLLLCIKTKPAWIKRSIHYVTLQHYNPGELLKENPPYLKRDFWYKRRKFVTRTVEMRQKSHGIILRERPNTKFIPGRICLLQEINLYCLFYHMCEFQPKIL